MSRKQIGKHLIGIGSQALTRLNPDKKTRPRRKGDNSYNNCLQCSKNDWRSVFLQASDEAARLSVPQRTRGSAHPTSLTWI